MIVEDKLFVQRVTLVNDHLLVSEAIYEVQYDMDTARTAQR